MSAQLTRAERIAVAANVAGPIGATSTPGIACAISDGATVLNRDNEPGEYFCLASTTPAYHR